jgi:PAS domain S-box-containing protein
MPYALVVDDHPQNRYLLRCLLAADGYEVLEAANGQEALDLARMRTVNVVVSDILMPTLDGFTLCRAWRADPALCRIPFIFYTATYTDPRDEAFARSLGAADFIVKPTEPLEVRERIRRTVQASLETPPAEPLAPEITETPYLKQYNEVLIRKLEDKLSELETANEALVVKDFALASATSGILIADVVGSVTYANPAMAQLCGSLPEGLLGMNVCEILLPPSTWADWLSRAEGGYSFDSQLLRTEPHPHPTWLSVTAHFILSAEHQPVGMMISCRDITEERRLRDELARTQRLEALSLFSAGIAHDFNNLLVAMFAGLEFGTASELEEAERQEYRATGLAALQRAKDLTGRLLSFSRGNVGKKQAVNLKQLLNETLLLSFSGSGTRYETRFAPEPATVEGNAGQLAQVFSNLFFNARQAMNEAGTVFVSVERDLRSHDDGVSSAESVFWVIRVKDEGPGIPPAVLPQIFEPYFTTKPTGTGLGLATCHAIVRDHGGRINVTSQVGAGASFEVWLPVSLQAPVSVATTQSVELVGGTGRILVMDEQVIIQALMQRSLERAGYFVVSVSNGEQVLLEFDRAQQAGAPFDLLIVDVTVRNALGGLETLLALRRQGYLVPVIASTGYCDENTVTGLLHSGFDRVLGKPFFLHELLSVVKAVLGDEGAVVRNPPTIRSGAM